MNPINNIVAQGASVLRNIKTNLKLALPGATKARAEMLRGLENTQIFGLQTAPELIPSSGGFNPNILNGIPALTEADYDNLNRRDVPLPTGFRASHTMEMVDLGGPNWNFVPAVPRYPLTPGVYLFYICYGYDAALAVRFNLGFAVYPTTPLSPSSIILTRVVAVTAAMLAADDGFYSPFRATAGNDSPNHPNVTLSFTYGYCLLGV